MKHIATTLLTIAALAVACTAFAGPPIPGDYQTTDLGGVISTGRYTEGWQAGGAALLPGTTLLAESWNGVSLGTEWNYRCATTAAPAVMLTNTVNASGFGNRTYMKQFIGGTIWLSGAGPWANGDTDYPGILDSYTEFETVQYENFLPVAAVTNVQATAHFANYPAACMTFAVSNGVEIGNTPSGMTKPADYPDFLAADCSPTAPHGAWWNMLTMTLSVSAGCATSAHPSTWGAIKTLYR